jgi:hypothetical protein
MEQQAASRLYFPRPAQIPALVITSMVWAIGVAALWLGAAELLSWLLDSVWTGSALVIYGILLFSAYATFSYIVVTRSTQRLLHDFFNDHLLPILVGPVGFFIIFIVGSGEFIRYWSLAYGGFTPAGETNYWPWALYSVSWALDNGFG